MGTETLDKENEVSQDTNWQDTMLPPKMWFLNAYSSLSFLPFIIYWHWYTLMFALTGVFIFWVFERKGYEPMQAILATRAYLNGTHIPSCPANRISYWR